MKFIYVTFLCLLPAPSSNQPMKNGQQQPNQPQQQPQPNPSMQGGNSFQQQQQQIVVQNQNDVIPNGNSTLNGVSSGGGPKVNMRNDLHFAADSVSAAMSSLVRELNTGEPLFLFIIFCYIFCSLNTKSTNQLFNLIFSHEIRLENFIFFFDKIN